MKLAFSLLCLTMCPVLVSAEESNEKYIRGVLAKSLQAMGNSKEAIARSAVTSQATGTVTVNNIPGKLKATWSFRGIHQMHVTAEVGIQNLVRNIVVVSGIKTAWSQDQEDASTDEAPKDVVKILHHSIRALRLSQHPYFLLDKKYKLDSLGEMKIGTADAIGIKIREKGKQEVDLYLNKSTHLPHKCSFSIDESNNGNGVDYSITMKNYKKIGNRKHFTEMLVSRGDKEVIKIKLTSIQLKKTLDKSLFEKP